MTSPNHIPSVSVTYARGGSSTRANELGMRPMQERTYQKRGEPSSSHSQANEDVGAPGAASERLEVDVAELDEAGGGAIGAVGVHSAVMLQADPAFFRG